MRDIIGKWSIPCVVKNGLGTRLGWSSLAGTSHRLWVSPPCMLHTGHAKVDRDGIRRWAHFHHLSCRTVWQLLQPLNWLKRHVRKWSLSLKWPLKRWNVYDSCPTHWVTLSSVGVCNTWTVDYGLVHGLFPLKKLTLLVLPPVWVSDGVHSLDLQADLTSTSKTWQ